MLDFYLSIIDTEEEKLKFENIYHKFRGLLYNVAIGFMKDHQLACEVLSKVWEIIATHIDEIDTSDMKRLENFILKVVKNASLNYLNDRHIRNAPYSLEDFEEAYVSESLEETIIGDEAYKRLLLAINSMPELYKDVLSLYYVDGYSPVLIAKALSRPYATIRTQIRRGTDILKTLLKENGFYD